MASQYQTLNNIDVEVDVEIDLSYADTDGIRVYTEGDKASYSGIVARYDYETEATVEVDLIHDFMWSKNLVAELIDEKGMDVGDVLSALDYEPELPALADIETHLLTDELVRRVKEDDKQGIPGRFIDKLVIALMP
jgi:hypothetical protein